VTRERVGDRAASDGEVGIGVRQHAERRTAPRIDRLDQPRCDAIRAEDPAVQEQRVRRRRSRVTGEERGDVARDCDVPLVRKSERDERTARPGGFGVPRRPRPESIEHDACCFLARQRDPQRRADQARPCPCDRDRSFGRRILREQRLLGPTAGGDELRKARGVELLADPRFARRRQGEVHVVATEEQVTPDRDARDLEP